jgi:hypothetical protein
MDKYVEHIAVTYFNTTFPAGWKKAIRSFVRILNINSTMKQSAKGSTTTFDRFIEWGSHWDSPWATGHFTSCIRPVPSVWSDSSPACICLTLGELWLSFVPLKCKLNCLWDLKLPLLLNAVKASRSCEDGVSSAPLLHCGSSEKNQCNCIS